MRQSVKTLAVALIGASMLVLVAAPATAQLAWVGIGDGIPSNCGEVLDVFGNVIFVYVMVMESVPMQEIFIATTPPACNTMTLLAEQPMGGIIVPPGDIRTGLNFNLGGCFSGPMMLYEFTFFSNGTTPCCDWLVDPTVSFVDCNGATKTRVGRTLTTIASNPMQCAVCEGNLDLEPHSPSPAIAATTVPLEADLSWVNHQPPTGPVRVLLGTTSGVLSEVYNGPAIDTFDPGVLDPGQDYYWQVESQNVLAWLTSEEWSFTTESPLPAQEASWGAIKALYGSE